MPVMLNEFQFTSNTNNLLTWNKKKNKKKIPNLIPQNSTSCEFAADSM